MKQALGYGEFFGSPSRHYEGAGIVLSHLIATGTVEPHVHDDPHPIWITGGHYVSSAAGEVDDRPFFIYNPAGTSHRDHFRDGRGSFFTISMRPLFLGRGCELPPEARHVSHPRVRGRAFELMQEFWGGPDSSLLVEGLCTELIAAFSEAQDERKPPTWLARAREVLHERAAEDLSLAEVAGEMDVHPIHFTRAFRRFFGCTPGVYLRACRLQLAADLLLHSDIGLSEITFAAGFSDQSHFTHRFTKHFGLAPGAYRRLTT